ncbi:MAG TPA: hypothetical protein VJ464_20695 [Blastocatellia bacterium]|nr:hypothetical protein [Blastocatellia bacterium]
MFGIFKTGIKLGIGCFVAGILFVLLLVAAWYYYFGRKPEPRPRNQNRRAATLPLNRGADGPSARPLL